METMVFRGIANRLRAMAIEAVFDRLCGGTIFTSKKLILAYTIDWVLIMYVGPRIWSHNESSTDTQAFSPLSSCLTLELYRF